jgi:GGDEF domain-containing protein
MLDYANVLPAAVLMLAGPGSFVVLATACELSDDVRMVAERLRASTVALQLQMWPDLRVTGSVGGALRADGEIARQTLKRADDAMLDAKLAGRNLVVIAEPRSANITDFPASGPRQLCIA